MEKQPNKYKVPFGKGFLEFDLPPSMHGTVIESRHAEPLPDVERATADALANPVNSPPLRELVRPNDTVCIVFTDITRACPDHFFVPPVLRELKTAGVRDDHVTLVCGTGLHRPSTPEEKRLKLGQEVLDRYRVLDNAPQNREALA
ncbi:MAG: lactate racemase domain-containing protein, partial [Desulfobacteraceae bacterium]